MTQPFQGWSPQRVARPGSQNLRPLDRAAANQQTAPSASSAAPAGPSVRRTPTPGELQEAHRLADEKSLFDQRTTAKASFTRIANALREKYLDPTSSKEPIELQLSKMEAAYLPAVERNNAYRQILRHHQCHHQCRHHQ